MKADEEEMTTAEFHEVIRYMKTVLDILRGLYQMLVDFVHFVRLLLSVLDVLRGLYFMCRQIVMGCAALLVRMATNTPIVFLSVACMSHVGGFVFNALRPITCKEFRVRVATVLELLRGLYIGFELRRDATL